MQAGTFHPAFRQLVEGAISREKMRTLLTDALPSPDCSETVTFVSNDRWFSNLIGHKGCNKAYFASAYPRLNILWRTGPLPDGQIGISVAGKPGLMVK